MKPQLTRREFLKLASTLSLAPLMEVMPPAFPKSPTQDQAPPNVIIILHDTLSALNLSLYGYPRKTSPNLERFAQRSTVYHAHHTAGNYTTPSTASLFTSTYPWTHGAYYLSSLISPDVKPNNIFRLLKDTYYQAAFTQNIYADMLLYQFQEHLDRHERLDSFALVGNTFYNTLFDNDAIYGLKSFDQMLFIREEAHGSLFLSILNDLSMMLRHKIYSQKLAEIQPDGLPRLANTDVYFLLEQVTDGVMEILSDLPSPSFTYLHLMPPHEPYRPTREFIGMFNDDWAPPTKKKHRLAPGVPEDRLIARRQTYDEFIANVDAELGRLLDHIEKIGLLDNSYVMVTSDHGELFERGVHGHSTPLVFEPLIRVPLIISSPGQQERKDVYTPTSNVDLLPSLLHIAGLPIPDWCEGQALPGLGGESSQDRSTFVVEAKKNPAHGPLRKATVAMIKGQYKLVHYLGYRDYQDKYELYDLENDPEELENVYPSHPFSKELQAELDQKFQEVNQPYQNNK